MSKRFDFNRSVDAVVSLANNFQVLTRRQNLLANNLGAFIGDFEIEAANEFA